MANTRKQRKGVMTIPQLRKAFEHMESFTGSLLTREKGSVAQRKAFQKEWQRVFHRSVDDKAADAYLKFEAKKGKKSKKGTRKQKGGSMPQLGMAPLDYSTRPGINGVHGTFPAYVTSGFDMYNQINQDSPRLGCGVENITPKIPADLGSNAVNFQKGGKRSRKNRTRKNRKDRKDRKDRQEGGAAAAWFSANLSPNALQSDINSISNRVSNFSAAVANRPAYATAPPSLLQDAQSAWKGQHLSPTPSPNTGNPPYHQLPASAINAVAMGIRRDLGAEIRS